MEKLCPYCQRPEKIGLLCIACVSTLRYELREVRSIVHQLDFTISRQTKIQATANVLERPEYAEDETSPTGLAHERTPIHLGAVQAADDLAAALVYWARDTSNFTWNPRLYLHEPAAAAARYLRDHTPEIRRHGNVTELMDGCLQAIRHARNMTDQPAVRRVKVGPCPEDDCTGTVVAVIPIGTDQYARAECTANEGHRWASTQFFRLGERIGRRMEARRGKAGAA